MAGRAGGASTQVRYEIVEIRRLHAHERTRNELLQKLVAEIRADGFLRKPILVEARHFVILDGHHRVEALRVLGCTRIPVYLVAYENAGITLTTWPGATVTSVTKAEVVDHGVRDDPFPPKTTRHIVAIELEDVNVALD